MAILVKKGGKGSGNWGHSGRPGKVGGSAPRGSTPPKKISGDGAKSFAATADPPGGDVGSVMERQKNWYLEMKYSLRKEFASLSMEERGSISSVAGMAKNDVVTYLSKETGVDYGTANRIIRQWALTANEYVDSILIQHEVTELFDIHFGTELSDWQDELLRQYIGSSDSVEYDLLESSGLLPSGTPPDEASEMIQGFLKTMYDRTQRQLKDAGIDGVYLFRGIKDEAFGDVEIGDKVHIEPNAIESWTIEPSVAREFGADVTLSYNYDSDSMDTTVRSDGGVIAQYVPRERILSTPFSGFGCLREQEFVVIGARKDGKVVDDAKDVATYTPERGVEEDGNYDFG